jgi:hypothetical protein
MAEQAKQLAQAQSRQAVEELEHRLDMEADRHREELATAAGRADKAQERLEIARAELRAETELRAKAETRAQAFEQRVDELKSELKEGQREPDAPKAPKPRKRDGSHSL